MFGYIYETTNLINGKTYIGKRQGKFDNTYYGSGMILKQALKKYGRQNFKISVLAECDTECELNNAEVVFIEQYNPVYNIAKGGTGGDTLARASKSYKQEVIAKRKQSMINTWSSISEEQREQWGKNISNAKKGKATRPASYTHSEEVKQRIRESNVVAAKSRSTNWKDNHALAMAARKGVTNVHSQTPVLVNGIVYDGVIVAASALNVSRQTMHNWIKKGKATYVN
jgi:group I intron endonuclease